MNKPTATTFLLPFISFFLQRWHLFLHQSVSYFSCNPPSLINFPRVLFFFLSFPSRLSPSLVLSLFPTHSSPLSISYAHISFLFVILSFTPVFPSRLHSPLILSHLPPIRACTLLCLRDHSSLQHIFPVSFMIRFTPPPLPHVLPSLNPSRLPLRGSEINNAGICRICISHFMGR